MRPSFFALAALLFSVSPIRAESVEELIKTGDVHCERFQTAEALQAFHAAEKLEPNHPLVSLRLARQYRHAMVDTTKPAEKLRLGTLSVRYAERAAALAPNDAEAQLSPAVSLGKLVQFLGTKEQVAASPRIKAAADKALRLDPRNDLAWHILGRWHRIHADVSGIKRALAGAIYGKLPATTNADAAACLQKAIALNPTRLMHYIELGRIYAQMGRKEDARRLLNKGLAMPNLEKDDPEHKQRGREALAKLR